MGISKKTLRKSLCELERQFPSEVITKDRLPLVGNENDVVKIPIGDLDVENLAYLINQKLGLKYVVPMAIEILGENPFAEGEYIGRNLLGSLLSLKKKYWSDKPEAYRHVAEIVREAESDNSEEAIEVVTLHLPQLIYDFKTYDPAK